jgi:enamine deaminase RidA (YjgF/YER057c/UK114 family)
MASEPLAGEPPAGESTRRRISSGGPWEERFGYSRAIVTGDACIVSGSTDAGGDGRSRHPGDAAGQARAILELIDDVLARAGFERADVVRTRTYLIDPADVTAVGLVHGEWFAGIQPAATIVVVAGLIDPSLRVEIEVDARRG